MDAEAGGQRCEHIKCIKKPKSCLAQLSLLFLPRRAESGWLPPAPCNTIKPTLHRHRGHREVRQRAAPEWERAVNPSATPSVCAKHSLPPHQTSHAHCSNQNGCRGNGEAERERKGKKIKKMDEKRPRERGREVERGGAETEEVRRE